MHSGSSSINTHLKWQDFWLSVHSSGPWKGTVGHLQITCSACVVYTSAQENYSRKSTNPTKGDVMDARVTTIASIVLVLSTSVTGFWFTPRGPQIYSCLTYTEKNLRVDCEFPATQQVPGPYCEFKQDGKIIGTTFPNTPSYLIPTLEVRRRANVSLVSPTICRLTWAPMADERSYTYTCRVYQGSSWKENSMAFHQRNVLVCSAISIIFHSGPWLFGVMISLPVSMGFFSA